MIKPFSPLYFIKENKSRCAVLIFLVFLIFTSYIGGLYMTNPEENLKCTINDYNNYTLCYNTYNDKDSKSYNKLLNEVKANGDVCLLSVDTNNNYLFYDTIMGFENGTPIFTFSSTSDFHKFCKTMGYKNFKLNDGEVVLSRLFANNIGVKVGDTLTSDNKNVQNNLSRNFKVSPIIDVDGYVAFFMDTNLKSNTFMILNQNMSESEFADFSADIYERYNPDVLIYTKTIFQSVIETQLNMMKSIFYFIVFFMALVLSVTINAAFVGVYQKRHYEFAVYKAIGFSKARFSRKITMEILLIDAIGLIIGSGIFFLGLYLLNNLYLYDKGLYLYYYNPIALIGLIVCNTIVVIPLIFTRCKDLLKADISEY